MITAIILCLATLNATADRQMTPDQMLAILRDTCDDVQVQGHQIEFTFQEVRLVLIHDIRADRMRIMTPIAPVETLELGQVEEAMEANFHTALDARYAISQGVVWAAFIHPLSDLSRNEFRSAITQVASAKMTFGTTYSGGTLMFPGREHPGE